MSQSPCCRTPKWPKPDSGLPEAESELSNFEFSRSTLPKNFVYIWFTSTLHTQRVTRRFIWTRSFAGLEMRDTDNFYSLPSKTITIPLIPVGTFKLSNIGCDGWLSGTLLSFFLTPVYISSRSKRHYFLQERFCQVWELNLGLSIWKASSQHKKRTMK